MAFVTFCREGGSRCKKEAASAVMLPLLLPLSYACMLVYYGCISASAAALVGHLKMRECPPLSPQPPYEVDTRSDKLSSTCPSPLPTPDINLSSSTINLNDEAVSFRYRPMSTQTFPFDVFTNKGLVCSVCSSFIRYPLLKTGAETQAPSPTTCFYYFRHIC